MTEPFNQELALAKALVRASITHNTDTEARWAELTEPTKQMYLKRARWLIADGWTHHDNVG